MIYGSYKHTNSNKEMKLDFIRFSMTDTVEKDGINFNTTPNLNIVTSHAKHDT